jgi:hypothetical protein
MRAKVKDDNLQRKNMFGSMSRADATIKRVHYSLAGEFWGRRQFGLLDETPTPAPELPLLLGGFGRETKSSGVGK